MAYKSKKGWTDKLARISMYVLVLEIVSGLVLSLKYFSLLSQWGVLFHTVIGVIGLVPLNWHYFKHWKYYQKRDFNLATFFGYLAVVSVLVCSFSGILITYQGFFSLRSSEFLRTLHLISTFVILVTVIIHIFMAFLKVDRNGRKNGPSQFIVANISVIFISVATFFLLGNLDSAKEWHENEFPKDYNFLYGENRPFAPSLATTDTGKAFDDISLAGSKSCGTTDCHQEIYDEWLPSAHRYAAMDPFFQKIQKVMAESNGAESTRYCAGCHDPISLFSGTKNIFVKDLSNQHGFKEGISCLSCHGITKIDLKGNASYVMTQPSSYLWQWEEKPGIKRSLRDFLIRTYPNEHKKLQRRMYKTPEYCATCHKQFIDKDINKVGWVQLQNQYDNWAASHWNNKLEPGKTLECRECHMPLVESNDPASGDVLDENRTFDDQKHRSHRFLGANNLVPKLLKLKGWKKQIALTHKWLKGKLEIPEISHKWRRGAAVNIDVELPESIKEGSKLPIKVIVRSNKVGHDFPTGPLDVIQSWIEIIVTDDTGKIVFTTGTVNEKKFIEPGSFIFKAEPVDQNGNLIDKHNLWEMVGVRFKRAIFPGYSDAIDYQVDYSSVGNIHQTQSRNGKNFNIKEKIEIKVSKRTKTIKVRASLKYRKIGQFLMNYAFEGDTSTTSPIVELSTTTKEVKVIH